MKLFANIFVYKSLLVILPHLLASCFKLQKGTYTFPLAESRNVVRGVKMGKPTQTNLYPNGLSSLWIMSLSNPLIKWIGLNHNPYKLMSYWF